MSEMYSVVKEMAAFRAPLAQRTSIGNRLEAAA
jgi:hypothetical protein